MDNSAARGIESCRPHHAARRSDVASIGNRSSSELTRRLNPRICARESLRREYAMPKKAKGFTDEERAAMKEYVQERKADARRGRPADKADGESAALAAIAALPPSDRAMAERLHALITATAPELWPKTWYGMPAYAKDGNVVCFFQSAQKFKTRYATLGFSDKAHLDEGHMWPTVFALEQLTPAEEARIVALVKKAVS
jgi:uncharacterized protein YdhG (YjbR/CyaY superfamily)